nr:probable serine/threonine-protein kinase DDB_G0278509 [Nomia melanderi]
MSDLAKTLLSEYYGLNSESTNKTFVSIHKSIENAKAEEEKHFTEQTSVTTNEENVVSEDEYQKDIDDDRKFSVEIEEYRRPVRAFNNIEDAYDSDENSVIYDIDSEQKRTECPNITPVFVTKENDIKDTNGSDSSITYAEDILPDNLSDASDTTLRKSRRSSKTCTPLPPLSKKPVCNEIFADFSNADLKQFPQKILNEFLDIRMLYLADNSLTQLPNEVFTTLRHLEWLDIRNNQISSLPSSIESHPCIQTLLLQANNMEELPLELCKPLYLLQRVK